MKAKQIIVICTAMSILFTACKTPLYIAPIERIEGNFGNPNMEFIGFINTPRDEKCIYLLQDFGRELERNKIAVNRQEYSLGSTFGLEQLANLSSEKRYVSFVNILDSKVKYNDDISDNIPMVRAGWWIAILTIFTTPFLYVPLMVAGDKNDCQQQVKFNAELCIYDTHQKQLVNIIPIEINHKQIYKGQFENEKTNHRSLEASEKRVLQNALIEYFGHAYDYIQKLMEGEEEVQLQKAISSAHQ